MDTPPGGPDAATARLRALAAALRAREAAFNGDDPPLTYEEKDELDERDYAAMLALVEELSPGV